MWVEAHEVAATDRHGEELSAPQEGGKLTLALRHRHPLYATLEIPGGPMVLAFAGA
jgi:hypothetical protein